MGGLGESICTKMADQGYAVVTTYSPGNKTASEWLAGMKKRGYDFHGYAVDVADFDSCVACLQKVRPTSARSTCWSTMPALRAT